MSRIPEIDPTDDMGAAGDTRGGGNDDTQDWSLPGGPTNTPDEQRRWWERTGARPKYQKLPEDIPLSKLPKEKSGLPDPKGTAETFFTEGLDYSQTRILLENEKLEYDYPKYKDSLERLTLEYRVDKNGKGRIWVKGPNKGWYPLYMAEEETLNTRLPKTIRDILGPKRTELIQQKDEEIEELDKTIEEDTRVADDENEDPVVRERSRERITDNTERKDQLVQEREQLEGKLSLREKVKRIFKKYGWTLQAVVLAAGLVIGAVALAVMNGLKAVTKTVGTGLKEIGKKVASILPGLIGSIVSFIFRAAGQVIYFLSKNAWLLIIAVVAMMRICCCICCLFWCLVVVVSVVVSVGCFAVCVVSVVVSVGCFGFFLTANPWDSVAFLWIGFEG